MATPRPVQRPGSAHWYYRRRLKGPERAALAAVPRSHWPRGWSANEIWLSLRTTDKAKAKERHGALGADVERALRELPRGVRALTHKEVVAFAGKVYRAFIAAHSNEPGPPESLTLLAAILRSLKAHGKAAGAIGRYADKLLLAEGVITDQQTRDRVTDALASAVAQAVEHLGRNARGDYRPDPEADRFPEWRAGEGEGAKSRQSVTLSRLFDGWQSEGQRDSTDATVRRWRPILLNAAKFLGHEDAGRITTADVVRWKDHLIGAEGRDPRSVMRTSIAGLKAVLQWGVDNHLLPANPAKGVKVRAASKPQAREKDLTEDEAHAILHAALSVRPGKHAPRNLLLFRWAPWLCAYTGARSAEITQLRKEDFKRVSGIWVIQVTPEAGSVKTGKPRLIPLHPHLLEQGIVEMAQSRPAGPLFYEPDAKQPGGVSVVRAKNASKKLSTWIQAEGLVGPGVRPVHGFRHRFKTLCDLVGVEEKFSDAITGHTAKSVGRAYGAGSRNVAVLYREICKLPRVREDA